MEYKNRIKLDDLTYAWFSGLANRWFIDGYDFDGKLILISTQSYPDINAVMIAFTTSTIVWRDS